MYLRRGPWPQPAPDHPMAMAAEVLHPSFSEKVDWYLHSGLNYFKTMLTSIPGAAYNAFAHGSVADMTDELFTKQLTTTVLSKYLRPTTIERLGSSFAERLSEEEASQDLWVADYSPIQDVQPYEGMYVSPTVTLFAREGENGPFRLLAMSIGNLKDGKWHLIVLRPSDGNAWELAKYFAMQGAAHFTTLAGHPATHFPYDTVNAVTISSVPKKHTLFKLLHPHLRLALAVNHAVLEGGHSVVSESRGEFYAPFVAPGTEVRQLVAAAYVGYPHDLSRYAHSDKPWPDFPAWRFPLEPRFAPSDFGRITSAYHKVIKDFVRKIVADIFARAGTPEGEEELYYVKRWARYVAHWLPGFPDDTTILENDAAGDPNLVNALTGYIWDVSVMHTAEHRSFYLMTPRRMPFRVHIPPPVSRELPEFNRRKVLDGWDLFKSTLAFNMFFQPHNVELLKDVKYSFKDRALAEHAKTFRQELLATEKKLVAEGIDVDCVAPLGQIASSIQY
jgi:hypothetical protein